MWLIGIDEAGYGPNLGPFVMTAVAFRVPQDSQERDLWKLLRAAVRRPDEDDDERLLIEDSKQVYSTARGLAALEYGVLAALPWRPSVACQVAEMLNALGTNQDHEIHQEIWFHGQTSLPTHVESPKLESGFELFSRACREADVFQGLIQSAIICPGRFNQIVDYHGTKGAVLGQALAQLLPTQIKACSASDKILCFIDKHGGRNSYAAMLQDALCEGIVLAHEECMARSVYTVHGLEREVRLTFQPRADAEHFCVALASMVSKYVRELLMLEFNQYWLGKVDGLKPTAGYPGDAARFYHAIRPAIKRLAIAPESIWRCR
jgi:ribonuclease HII